MRRNKLGCFEMKNGFPDEYYAFTDGEMSATVEKNGGINTIGCLDVFEKNGKLYPDRHMTPIIFRKEGSFCEKRPVYGPAVRFVSTCTSKDKLPSQNIFHIPDEGELYPFGFKSKSSRLGHKTTYDMAITGRKILFSFTNNFPDRKNLEISISRNHIFQGETATLKDHVDEGNNSRPDAPFREDTRFIQEWARVSYDCKMNAFVMEGVMRFMYGDKNATVIMTSSHNMEFCESKDFYSFVIPWGNKKRIDICLIVACSEQEALRESKEVLGNFDSIFSRQIKENERYASGSTQLAAEAFSSVENFSRTAPAFLKAMVFAKTEKEACIRAAAHKYGFFNMWDQAWPARAFLLMGDWDTAKKLIKYPADMLSGHESKYEHNFLAMFVICIAGEIVAVSGDKTFLKDIFPDLKRLLKVYAGRSDENGLVATSGTCGIDDPTEIGITGNIWASCLNGLWYDACRYMENMAISLKDEETAVLAGGLCKKIKSSYLKTFYKQDTGYLYSSVNPETEKGIDVFQNVATLGMDFGYGENLLYPRIKEIASFQKKQLYHPAGRSAVPYWDNATEMWKNCLMWQHIAHEMRTARSAGFADEIERMMNIYFYHFEKNKLMLETHNLSGCNGDISQRANWQAFATRALYSGIFESLAGIICDDGGLTYVPCAIKGKSSITGFRIKKGKWNISISGEGNFVKELLVDGSPVRATLKVPAAYFSDNKQHSLEIVRSGTPFNRPTLLAATGASVGDIVSESKKLSFTVIEETHATFKIYCPGKPVIKINGTKVPFDWQAKEKTAWVDLKVAARSRLEVVL